MFKRKFIAAVFTAVILLFFAHSPAFGLEWQTDLEKGLDEARERGAPAFIFLTQLT